MSAVSRIKSAYSLQKIVLFEPLFSSPNLIMSPPLFSTQSMIAETATVSAAIFTFPRQPVIVVKHYKDMLHVVFHPAYTHNQ